MMLPDPVLEALKRAAPDLCVCLFWEAGDNLGIAGVTDFATAEAWRLQDTERRAFMLFAFGKLDSDCSMNEDEKQEEARLARPRLPEPVIPKTRKIGG